MRDELKHVLMAAQELSAAELPRLLGELREVEMTVMAWLIAPRPTQSQEADQLVGVREAAQRLGTSRDYVYRHHRDFPFTRRIGRKLLFSSLEIDRYIRQQGSLTARRQISMLSPARKIIRLKGMQ